jgi:hypothetical protein
MKITKEQILKFDRKFNREEELKNSNGWTAKHKVHNSIKNYSRKNKHKLLEY